MLLAGTGINGYASAKKFRSLEGVTFAGKAALKQNALKQAAPHMSPMGVAAVDRDPDAAISDTEAWGLLTGTDGKSWFYSQSLTVDSERRTYTGSTFTVTDASHNELATINVAIDDSENVNVIEPFGTVTNKFFDRDQSTWEVLVYIHKYDADYNQSGEFRVYNNSGEIVQSYAADDAMFIDLSEGYNSYQRLVLVSSQTENDSTYKQVDIYQPCGWNDAPTVAKSFKLNYDELNYMSGSFLNAYKVDGKPYFVLARYEKPFFVDDSADDPVMTSDNHYILDVYDKSFNLAKTVTVPVKAETGALYGFRVFGMFSDDFDLNKGMFTGDDQFNLIVGNQNYTISNDDYTYTFDVYNENSEKVKTINQDVSSWMQLSDIAGQEKQFGFLITGTSAESIEMVNVPSCKLETTFSAIIGDAQLSDNFDRYPVGNDNYQYVFGIGNGIYDNDSTKNVISRIGWFNRDCTVDHYVKINIGPDGELFTPLINSTTLNPYLFNTDDQHEYVFIAKIKNDDNTLSNQLMVANDNGDIIMRAASSDERGDIGTCDVLDDKLVVTFANQTTSKYTIDFYDLPFTKFGEGGNGTAESPYQIATVGDLQQIASAPSAYYEIVNDLDMTNKEWTPIDQFSGHLDGKDHTIYKMSIDADNNGLRRQGLFGQIVGEGQDNCAEVKNLKFYGAQLNLNSSTNYAGLLAGSVTATKIDNILVNDMKISNGAGVIGGLVGDASLYSSIASSYVDANIDAADASKVGGIAGALTTSSTVNASAALAVCNGGSNIGGIAGTTDSSSSDITNCEFDGELSGTNSIGGIVGQAGHSKIENCVVSAASLTGSAADRWTNLWSMGYIVGDLVADYSGSTTVLIQNNIAGSDCSMAFPEGSTEYKGVHSIVGSTSEDQDDPATEAAIGTNYALSSTPAAASSSAADGTATEASALTEEFLTSAGYVFGDSADKPWKMVEDEVTPVLYFMYKADMLTLDYTSLLLELDEEMLLHANVWGADDSENIAITVDTPDVVEVSTEKNDEDGSLEVTVKALQAGTATITATYGSYTAKCVVTVKADASVNTIAADSSKLTINYADGIVTAAGAARIDVYSLMGALQASANAESLSIDAKGLYVVVATDAAGHRTVKKIIAK